MGDPVSAPQAARRPSRPLPGSIAELTKLRAQFGAGEPRDLYYRVAGPLLSSALADENARPTVAEALALLLLSWNSSYYRFRPPDPDHLDRIAALVRRNRAMIDAFRGRRLVSLVVDDRDAIARLFDDFERELGIVGAAKALHLLAPDFFPIWDRRIATAYGVDLGAPGIGLAYAAFAGVFADECRGLASLGVAPEDLVKAVDEVNYVTITMRALKAARGRRAGRRVDAARTGRRPRRMGTC
jgi:hypothetical protein